MYDTAALFEQVPLHDRLDAARALVESVIATDPCDLGDAAMTERVLAGAALEDRVRALTTLAVGVWEPRKTWTGSNARSARMWLGTHAELGSVNAGRLLRAGRLTAKHPVVATALRDGQLSCRKLDLLTDAVNAGRDEVFERDAALLVNHVCALRHDLAAQLMTRWKYLADDAVSNAENEAQVDKRQLHHSRVGNRWRTDGSADLWSGAIIDAALRDAMDGPDSPDREGGQRSAAQRRHDALVNICQRHLCARNLGKGANPVATVNIHVSAEVLFGSSDDDFDPDAVCDLYPGGPIPRNVARQALADSYVGEIVFNAERDVISYGKLRRHFSGAQRRAIIARDGPHCAVPGCGNTVDECEAHHLIPFSHGGPTDIANGAMVCRGNHHDITNNKAHLARGPDGTYSYRAPNGTTYTEAHFS